MLTDSSGNNVSIDSHWRSTMMANSGKDPLWQAKISSEAHRNPHLQSVIEEKCSRCHMGMARYQAITNGSPVAVLGTGFLDPNHSLHAAAMDGVSCTLCHQVQAAGLGTEATFTGQYFIDTSTSPPSRQAFGPFSQPVQNPMIMQSGFTPIHGAHVGGSSLCGSCHTLYTPYVDAQGNVLGEFPEQTTYLEWEHSTGGNGRSCRDCHVPDAAGSVVISNRPWWLSPRSPFGQHHFVGGNSYMVDLLKANATILGVTADPAHMDATSSRANTRLQTSTAALTFGSASLTQDVLTFTINVENKAGHKLPSGIPARRTWLHVTVKDSAGNVVFESGKPLTDGSISGNDGDLNPSAYEPHYDLINTSDQVQIYEPVMIDTDQNVTHTLLRAADYVKDNRLLPLGFNKATASSDIGVVGSAANDANFSGGQDQVTYQISVPSGSLTVTAELLYQALSYSFSEDMRPDSTSLVSRFMSMYDASDKTPKIIASAQKSFR
jgi:hypothetical protein